MYSYTLMEKPKVVWAEIICIFALHRSQLSRDLIHRLMLLADICLICCAVTMLVHLKCAGERILQAL